MKYKTDINVILDRSSSMGLREVYDATIIGFNRFLEQQKEVAESARMNFYQFNTTYEVVYTDKDVKLAPELNKENFRPAGCTALLDAIGKTINDVGSRLRNMREQDRPEQVLVVVITDGEENSSREFTKDKIEEMVNHQKDVYKWQFVYVGANLEAIQSGHQYSSFDGSRMDREQVTSGGILATPGEYVVNAFNKLGKSTQKYRSLNKAQVNDIISLDATTNEQSAKEAKELLDKK